MNDEQYLQRCRELWQTFARTLAQRTAALEPEDPLRALALEFAQLPADDTDWYVQAPQLIARLFTTFPEFAPTLPRELLWFLGGDCLHYMPDEEIALYQELDEQRSQAAARGELIDFEQARAKLQKRPAKQPPKSGPGA